MIKIQEVKKGEGYYTVIFTDGMKAYGVLITLVDKRPVYIEFMKFTSDFKDIVSITEDENPEEFKLLKEKYFDQILKEVNK
jgi:predicted methyltransferase